MKKLAAVCLVLFLAGCGGASTLDTSSDEALQASIEAMGEGKTQEEKEQLAASMMTLVMKEGGMQKMFEASMSGGNAPPTADLFKSMHGKTAQQIINEAKAAAEQMEKNSQ